MKVYFSDHIFSSQRYGGVSRIFAEILPRIEKSKIDVGYLGCTHINDYFDPPTATPSVHVPWMPRPMRRAANDLVESYYLKTRRPDIVHVTYYPTALRTARYSKAKLAVTVYDMIHERMPKRVDPTDPTPALKRAVCKKADLIFAISESTKRDLVELYDLSPQKIVVTHLASSLKPINRASTDRPTSCEKPFFLYVGARAGYKNFAIVLHAFAEVVRAGSISDLICFGGPPFHDVDIDEFRRMGLQGRIFRVTGDDDILAKHYQSAICLIYPSLYEGFGIPPLEAMAQGCPVISSNSSSLPEVVGRAGILFDPHDPEVLIKAMWDLDNSSSTRSDLIKLGFEQESRFSWQRAAAQTTDGYRTLF